MINFLVNEILKIRAMKTIIKELEASERYENNKNEIFIINNSFKTARILNQNKKLRMVA